MASSSQTLNPIKEVSVRIGANHSFHNADYPELKSWLRLQWIMAAGDGPASASWFERLFQNYTESTRHYHTAVHIKEMLEYIQVLNESIPSLTTLSSTITLRLATFFHDAIYDPTSSKNELASAELFKEFCVDVPLDHVIQSSVETLILATEKHKILEDSSVESNLQIYFLDVDMAVLGKKSSAYLAYAALIRKEYQHVPREIYCEKRAAILEAFCMGRIFLSDIFHEILETQAKENLQTEINLLRMEIIPGELLGFQE